MSEVSTITVNRTELGNALTFAQLGLSRRPVVPVLCGMLVTISSGTLELAAFDYEIAARAIVGGQASGPGSILANGGELAAAVKSLPKGKRVTAELTITSDTLTIECDGTESVVSSLPRDEYPTLPAMPELAGYLDGEMFARSVKRVSACAGTDDTLPYCYASRSPATMVRLSSPQPTATVSVLTACTGRDPTGLTRPYRP